MYYKFSGFAQRLAGATATAAYNPQPDGQPADTLGPKILRPLTGKQTLYRRGFKPLVPTDSPHLIFGTSKPGPGLPAADPSLVKNKVPDLQKVFQKSDGLPVHLKLGYPDRLLYRTTMALTIGGTIYCLIALIIASQPKKQK